MSLLTCNARGRVQWLSYCISTTLQEFLCWQSHDIDLLL